MRNIIFTLLGWLLLSAGATANDGSFFTAPMVVLDERFYQFIDPDSKIERLVPESGREFGWAEGPVWVESLNSLLFSDVAADTVYQWNETSGISIYLQPSGHSADGSGHAWRGSNGLAVDAQGNLLLAQQSNRTLSRMLAAMDSPAPEYQVLVERYQGKRINSPNDLVLHSSGDIYFTDPPYGLSGFENSPAIELDFFGVFRRTQDGQLVVIDRSLEKPNGIALSVDQRTLLVSNSVSDRPQIVAIGLDAEGNAKNTRLFFDAGSLVAEGAGSTDGIAIHPSDFLFVSIPNGLGILSPQGELLGKIALGQITNMAFDESFDYLYLTAPQQLLRLKIKSVALLRK
jgi:gluconolactonase